MADTPDARFWHASQCVGDRIYVWGGRTKSYQQEKMPCFEEFDSNKRSSGWHTLTDVDPQDAHPATSQVACASYSDFLYLFGGSDGNEFNNILSKLDLKKKKWEQLTQQKNASMSPMKKDACGMAHFTTQSGEHILIVMCGYANTSHSTDAKSNFVLNKNSKHGVSGWTNEIHMFDTAKDDWSVPEITGSRPEPCADVTFTSIDKQRGVFYGGQLEESCLYLIDINSMNMEVCSRSPPKRLGLHGAAAGCIGYNSGKPCLLISGGRCDYNKDKPLGDIWIFDPQSRRWKEGGVHDRYHAKMARWGHTVTVIMHTDSLVEVLMFGGSSDPFDTRDLDNIPRLAQPVSLIYGYGYHISDEWTLIGVVDKTESYRQFGLQGVEVLQTTTVTVTNSECTFEWEGYGLKLHIPENSLPSDVKQITLTIIASIAGHYKFPENFSLFSGVYWFCYEPRNVKLQLKKPVKLEIQHCAKPDCTSSLSFVRASSNQEKLPYTFEHLKGGNFTSCSSYGTLEVNNFCGICIAGESGAKGYLASVFYLRHETVYREISIAVILDDDAHRRASEKKFFKPADDEVSIDFESDEITLDIQEALEIEGWKLYPKGYPMVKKEKVDNSLPDQIYSCRILADVVDPSKARKRPLYHRVNLLGAKAPSNYINIFLSVGDGGGGSAHGSSRAASAANTTSDNPPTLPMMMRILLPVSSQWMNIGVMLSLSHGRLTAIETRCSGVSDNCLREMLNEWLQQDNPRPTKSALVDAVEKYNPSLAEKISAL